MIVVLHIEEVSTPQAMTVESTQHPLAPEASISPPPALLRCVGAAVLFLLGTFHVLRARAINLHEFADFQTFYGAARAYAAHGNPYGHIGPWPYLYPPPLLTFVAPLTHLGLAGAVLVWTAFLFLVFLIAAWVTGRVAWPSALATSPWAVVLIPALLAYRFVLRSTNFGQVDLIVFLAVALGLLALQGHRSRLAGACLAVAAMIKVLPGLFAAWLLMRDRRALLAMLVALVLLAMIPVADQGWDGAQLWMGWVHGDVLSHATDVTQDNVRDNQSVSATAARLLAMAGWPAAWLARLVWAAATVVIMGATFGALATHRSTIAIEGALVQMTIHLISRKTWETHLVTLMLPYAVLLATALGADRSSAAGRFKRRWAMAGIAGAAILTHIHSPLFVTRELADRIQTFGPTTLAIGVLWMSLLAIHRERAG